LLATLSSSGPPTPCTFDKTLSSAALTIDSVWGFADGARRVGVDGEIIAYAVLDVLAKPVFGTWLLLTHAKLRESEVELGGFWAHGLNREGALRLNDDDGA
jgi:hypothetical protein